MAQQLNELASSGVVQCPGRLGGRPSIAIISITS